MAKRCSPWSEQYSTGSAKGVLYTHMGQPAHLDSAGPWMHVGMKLANNRSELTLLVDEGVSSRFSYTYAVAYSAGTFLLPTGLFAFRAGSPLELQTRVTASCVRMFASASSATKIDGNDVTLEREIVALVK